MSRPNPRKLQQQCNLFNARNPVGTKVVVRLDDGRKILTTTRTTAQLLSVHSAVIWLDGISGCYMLDRVTVAEEVEA